MREWHVATFEVLVHQRGGDFVLVDLQEDERGRFLIETVGYALHLEEVGAVNEAIRLEVGRQVGASGTWVTARVYVAVGISGAIQHLQGMGACDKVVAINLDPGCDMIKRADLSVIGDSGEILRALIAAVQAHRSGAKRDAA